MDSRLKDLCKTCNIYYDGEMAEVQNVADECGLQMALSAMKRLSMVRKDPMKYPIEQFRGILSQKVRELRHERTQRGS